MSYSTFASE